MENLKSIPIHAQPEMLHIREARRSGVRRGINASIQLIETMLPRHRKGSSGRAELELVIRELQKLNIDEVEG